MRACILMASPHAHGNTAELCIPLRQELEKLKVCCHTILLHDKKVAPCNGCYQCQNVAGRYGCAIEDDMQAIVASMLASNLLIFATPIYTWQAPAPLKAVMDRMYGLNKFYGSAPRAQLNAGQSYALLATCGYDLDFGAGLLDEALRRWCQHSNLSYLGMCAVRDEEDLESFRKPAAREKAREFARRVVSAHHSGRPL